VNLDLVIKAWSAGEFMKDRTLCKATVLWQQDVPLAVITEGGMVWSLTDGFFIQVVCLLDI